MFKKPLTYIFPLPNIRRFLEDPSKNFVGRKVVKNNIISALKNSLKEGGSILIGGYRGVGKTTLVKKQIERLHAQEYEERSILDCKIDLGINADLSTREILCDISEEFSKAFFRYKKRTGNIYTLIFIAEWILIWATIHRLTDIYKRLEFLYLNSNLKSVSGILENSIGSIVIDSTCLFTTGILVTALIIIQLAKIIPISNIFQVAYKLQQLNESIRYSRAFHKSASVKNAPFSFSIKEVKNADPISPLRIEQELRHIFDYIAKRRFPMALVTKQEINNDDPENNKTESNETENNKVKMSWRDKVWDKINRTFFKKERKNNKSRLTKIWLKIKGYSSKRERYILEKLTRIQPIIIFDELDKINSESTGKKLDEKGRKIKIDELLGSLKSLLTSSRATFVFISGREMVDAYHSESGYTSALYEGLFSDIIYIPTLLADSSDGNSNNLHSMIEIYIAQLLNWNDDADTFWHKFEASDTESKEYIDHAVKQYQSLWKSRKKKKERNEESAYCYSLRNETIKNQDDAVFLHRQNIEFLLKLFTYFLTLHSWGNCKRLLTLLKQFLDEYDDSVVDLFKAGRTFIAGGELKKGDSYLIFNPKQLQRIYVSAKLYTVFENNLAAPLSKTDDKLIVSSLISALDIMKFYGRGFSRDSLDRTVEGINMHSEANLPHIIDDLINSVFFSIIRRTTGNLYDYRFFSTSEEEIRYLSKSLGARASSFEFALDATDPVRSFFAEERSKQILPNNEQFNSYHTNGNIEIILGDLCFYERSFDVAYLHYSNAVQVLKRILRTSNGKDWRDKGGTSFPSHYLLISALLKKGLIDEIRENNESSIRHYREARNLALYSFENIKRKVDKLYINFRDYGQTSPYNSVILPENYREWMFVESEERSGVRHKGMIIHAVLAADFLMLKSSMRPANTLFGKLDAYREIGKPNLDPDLFSRIVSLHYYAGEYQEIIQSNLKLVLKILSDTKSHNPFTQDEYQIAYLVGQSLFANHAKNLSYELSGDFLEDWTKEIKKLVIKNDKALEPLKPNTVDAIKIEKMHSKKINSSIIWLSFNIVFNAAKQFEKKGLYGRASQLYLSILINWIALLELVPWRKLSIEQALYEKLGDTPKWLERIIYCAQYAMEKSHQGAFRNERINYLWDKNRTEPLDIHEMAKNSFFQDQPSCFYSAPLIWYRSAHENYLLFLTLWEQFARKAICSRYKMGEKDKHWNILICQPIDSLPRVTAGYLWIKSRAGQHLLTTTIRKNNKRYTKHCYQVLEGFWQSLVYRKIGVRSEDPDTIPPKSIIFYNMLEVVKHIGPDGINAIKQYILKKEEKTKKDGKTKSIIPKKYLDIDYLKRNCQRQFEELHDLQNNSSYSYRRKIRHKHYLYDDFGDPLYLAEWSFSIMLSAGAYQHKKQVDRIKTKKKN